MLFNLDNFNVNNLFYFYSLNSDNNNRLVLPFIIDLFFVSTSDNVIHSWFIPELNIKLESNPGFINYYLFFREIPGLFFGNCAEICGQGHRIMPISIEICNYFNFLNFYF